jgi:putative PIN family toxin of toxin-antitoxin system
LRAVLDVNVLISALLSKDGGPASLLRGWLVGEFELVTSEFLIAELERALAYPKLRGRIPEVAGARFVSLMRTAATLRPDIAHPPRRSRDAGDDYLIALAEANAAILVTGDDDMLADAGSRPIITPSAFLARLGQVSGR